MADGSCSCVIWYSGERCETMRFCPPRSCSIQGASDCTVNMSKPVCHCLPDFVGKFHFVPKDRVVSRERLTVL